MLPKQIGIIGLGLMGMAMARRFQGAGISVLGYDIDDVRQHYLECRCKGTSAESPQLLTESRDTILLSLPTSDTVDAVMATIEASLRPETLIIDTTTGDPGRTAELGSRLAGRGVKYVDSKIAGSSIEVIEREAIVIVGGETATVEDCRPLFETFAKEIFHVGPCGRGAQMKLVLNLVLGLNRAVLAEGLSFARRCKFDPGEALKILKAGPSYSKIMDLNGQRMLSGDFSRPMAKLSQHLKDVGLIVESGLEHEARLPLSEKHKTLLEELMTAGYADADNSSIVKAFE